MTPRQKRFVAAYDGNATRAAIAAGYSPRWAGTNSSKLLRNTEIQAAIMEREKEELSGLIATRKERMEFWTQVMNNEEARVTDRLKASELLGKAEGDFLNRIDLTSDTPQIGVVILPEKVETVS